MAPTVIVKDLSGRRLFIELKLLLMESNPVKAIERMEKLDLLKLLSPSINYDYRLSKLLNNIKDVISWFSLLYLEESFDSWKTYWYGLTSNMDPEDVNDLASRLMMNDLESRRIINQSMDTGPLLDRLFRMKSNNNFSIYTLLSQYDTEFLLFIMAKANNENIKKLISNYFTRLKGTKVSLKGRDLKSMGFKPGPLYKDIFERLLEARLNREVNSRKEELSFVTEKFQKEMKSISNKQ